MVSANQIRQIVLSYLSDSDADKFVLSFSAASYNIHKNGNPEAIRLANEVESKLADLRGGFVSKSIFKENLRDLIKPSANNYVVMVLDYSCSVNQRAVPESSFRGLAGFSDTLSEGVFGSVLPVR